MKKYLSILAFSCLTLCSCDNFLDLTPQSVLTPENAYEKPEDWQQTLYAAYGTLQEVFVGKYTITLTEFGTDEVIPFDMGWAAYYQLHYYTFFRFTRIPGQSLSALLRRYQTLQCSY